MLHTAFVNEKGISLETRELDPLNLPEGFAQEWISLESRCLEPNIYLSPHFCLPAMKELTPDLKPIAIAIYTRQAITPVLIGLAIVVICPPRRDFPLPHLMCFESMHSYLSGLLLDRTHASSAAASIFKYLKKPKAPWHGLRVNNWFSSGVQGKLMKSEAQKAAVLWHEMQSYERACIFPSDSNEIAYQASYKAAGGKDMDRRIRRLKELGDLQFRVLRGADITQQTIESFLMLEDREWTREAKTSLLAVGHDTFLREVCKPLMRESRVFVSEILINNQPVASSLNFIAGDHGFAFKIGWDQALAKMSPGIINELWFMRDIRSICSDLQQIDSGASSGSFIEKIWPNRKTISSGIFITTSRGRVAVNMISYAKKIKAKLIHKN